MGMQMTWVLCQMASRYWAHIRRVISPGSICFAGQTRNGVEAAIAVRCSYLRRPHAGKMTCRLCLVSRYVLLERGLLYSRIFYLDLFLEGTDANDL
uniref:Uncharacterized protein n=1 Tax=Aegilops tauschii subsp. strangulata TaxID=200361 RepID=A0A453ARI7_AEGTS